MLRCSKCSYLWDLSDAWNGRRCGVRLGFEKWCDGVLVEHQCGGPREACGLRGCDECVGPKEATVASLTRERDEARAEVERLRARKDNAYEERNRLVALVVRMALDAGWKAGIGQHEDKPGEDWHPEWRTIVVVQTPMGQASWHLHDSHRHLFDWAPVYAPAWDGHTTEEKYARLDMYARSAIEAGEHDK